MRAGKSPSVSEGKRVLLHATWELVARYRHANWALADQVMVSGVNFLTGILLARYLGIEEFGRFTLAWMAILFVSSLQHAMINLPMMSIGPKQPEAEMSTYYGAVVVQQAVTAVLTFFLVYFGVHLTAIVFPDWNVQSLALPLAAAGVTIQMQDFLRRYFFTRLRGLVAFLSDTVRYLGQLFTLAALLILTELSMDLNAALWIMAVTAGLAAAGSCFFLEPLRWSRPAWNTTFRRHWNFAKWLTPSALMQWTSGSLFFMTAGVLLGPAAVGALRAAQTLLGVTHIFFRGMENIVPIRAAEHLHKHGAEGLSKYLKRVSVLSLLTTVLIAVILAAAPEFWLNLVFGGGYADQGYLVRWYGLIYLLIALIFPLTTGLRTLEHAKPIFWAYVAASVFALSAAYPVVKYSGVNGVIAGTLVIQLIMLSTLSKALLKKLRSR